MAKIKPIEQVPFTNSLGHTLNVGDNVLVVTTCTGFTNIKAGKYLGSRSYTGYNGTGVSVSVEVIESKMKLVHKETGKEWDYKAFAENVPYPVHPQIDWRLTSQVERNAISNKYADDQKAWLDKRTEDQKDYHLVDFPYPRRTTLQLNRIFPLNLEAKAFVGKRII